MREIHPLPTGIKNWLIGELGVKVTSLILYADAQKQQRQKDINILGSSFGVSRNNIPSSHFVKQVRMKIFSVSYFLVFVRKTEQRGIQNPVKHQRWSVL